MVMKIYTYITLPEILIELWWMSIMQVASQSPKFTTFSVSVSLTYKSIYY